MVKPPLRTKSIGFKVSEEEYAQLEMAAQADGRTLGEWGLAHLYVLCKGGNVKVAPSTFGSGASMISTCGRRASGSRSCATCTAIR
jgi:hypothetical protein